MSNPPKAPEAPKPFRPQDLVEQLFNATYGQYKDPREAARQIISFMVDAIVYAIWSTPGDEASHRTLLKNIGDSIANASPPPKP